MTAYSDAELKAMVVLYTIFSILSLIGSSLLIFTILKSKKKLSVPYRRLIFGISVFDIFQSAGSAAGILATPRGIGPWSIGNQTTCDITGFIFIVGACAVPLYTCSLCLYFFCIVRWNMKMHSFQRIEPFLHIVPIFYSIFLSIYAWKNQFINTWGGACSISASPYLCEDDPDVECTRGDGSEKFAFIFYGLSFLTSAVIICGSMTAMVCSAKKLEGRNRRYLVPRSSVVSNEEVTRRNSMGRFSHKIGTNLAPMVLASEGDDTGGSTSTHASRQQRKQTESNALSSRTREITKQALLYVGSFWLAYGWRMVHAVQFEITGTLNLPLKFLHCLFFPLQGFVNVFVYCRPHVLSLRNRYPNEYTWFRAFRVVLVSGGDSCRATVAEERQKHRQKKKDVTKRAAMVVEDDYFPSDGEVLHDDESAARDAVPTGPNEPLPVATKTDDDNLQHQQHSTWHWLLHSAGRSKVPTSVRLPEPSMVTSETTNDNNPITNIDTSSSRSFQEPTEGV